MSVLRYFRGLKIRPSGVYVRQTGAHVKLDRTFFRELRRISSLYIYIKFRRLFSRSPFSGRRPQLAFYPQPAGPWFNAWIAADMAGFKIGTDIDKADHIFVFDDATYSDTEQILGEPYWSRALNFNCRDISKTHVANVFEDVFGYSLRIDPLTYSGHAVMKSDINAAHDGKVVECPIADADLVTGAAYQKFIETRHSGPNTEDFRTIFVFGDLPVVFHKFKDFEKKFGTEYLQVDIFEAPEIFSEEEQDGIRKFCAAMGLDFGALDILRDKHDGRIYIVDVNKTCMPVLAITVPEIIKGFKKVSASFRANIPGGNY